jgi:hypothetical protein
MTQELEMIAADTLPHLAAGTDHHPAPGARCPNCDAPLHGPYCHACGQSADDHRRSFGHLCIEMVEDLFHLDGRLARTLPDLFFRPGRLARDYLERKLARHVPPFRMFLVALLVFMLVAEHEAHQATRQHERAEAAHKIALATPEGRAKEAAAMHAAAAADRDEALTEARHDLQEALGDKDSSATAQAEYRESVAAAQAQYQRSESAADRMAKGEAAPLAEIGNGDSDRKSPSKAEWKRRLHKAIEVPELFLMTLFEMGHRLAVVLLPILGFTLALAFRGRPPLFVYDHMLVAMQVLSFQFLLFTLVILLPSGAGGWPFGVAALWSATNLFQTLRGAYRPGLGAALVKTLLVGATTVFATLGLFLLLLFLAFYGL